MASVTSRGAAARSAPGRSTLSTVRGPRPSAARTAAPSAPMPRPDPPPRSPADRGPGRRSVPPAVRRDAHGVDARRRRSTATPQPTGDPARSAASVSLSRIVPARTRAPRTRAPAARSSEGRSSPPGTARRLGRGGPGQAAGGAAAAPATSPAAVGPASSPTAWCDIVGPRTAAEQRAVRQRGARGRSSSCRRRRRG